jgi:hypothetical protein
MRGKEEDPGHPKVAGWVKATPTSFHLVPALLTICQEAAAKRSISLELWIAEAIWHRLVGEPDEQATRGAESVRRWFKTCVVARPGSRVRPKAEAYLGSYVPWCVERDIEPVSLTRFGMVLKGDPVNGGCGVVLERTPGKRDCYLGIALTGTRH